MVFFAQAAIALWNRRTVAILIATGPVNPYRSIVERAWGRHEVLTCARKLRASLGITGLTRSAGINFVPAAHAATADFQMDGYAIIIP